MVKMFGCFFAVLLIVSAAFAAPGDIIRSQSISGQPSSGVRGLAKDWDTGDIWLAGPQGTDNIIYTSMDAESMSPGSWNTASGMYWVFDIGYGYVDGGTTYLLMNDQTSPYTKMIDPATGSYDGNLPDYYSASDYTDGNAVDWDDNYVYMSSYGSDEIVYYDGSSWTVLTTISGGRNMGAALGWEHLFIIRTSPYYTIEVYTLDGTFVESIPLNSWPSGNYLIGLSCGREDVEGDNESLFFADFVTLQVHEVEVGNYSTSLQRSTWGSIKASF